MALTRGNVEGILVKRIGKWLTAAGLDGTTNDGTNDDLNDAIGRAVRALGFTVADVTDVADANVSVIAASDYDKLFDLAELRALETCLTNYDKVNLSLGPRSESFDQLRNGMIQAIKLKREQIANDYDDSASLTGGVLALDFEEHAETVTEDAA